MAAVSAASLTATSRRVGTRLFLWGPVVLYMGAIFLVSGQSNPAMPPSVPDKALHGLAYFGLALLVMRAIGGGVSARLTWSRAVAAVSITIGYGATDELHQLFVPGRSADTRDLLADAVGAVTAPVVWWAILGNLRSRIPHSKSQD